MSGVLFIVSSTRSGSTLLERLLNELPGVVSAGELKRIWRRGFTDNQLCSCGQPFHDCPFWQEVVQRAFADATVDARANDALCRRVCRGGVHAGNVPAALRGTFLGLSGKLCAAIVGTARAGWVVDSSKDPAYAAQLAQLPGFETRYLHLVRDARAVAHSKSRLRRRPEIHWKEAYMRRRSAWASAGSWNQTQRLAEAARLATGRPWLRVRYEDLAGSPRGVVQQIWDWLAPAIPDATSDPLGFIDENTARVGSGHSVAGNPMRFGSGQLMVTPDVGWHQQMSVLSRAAVGLRCYRGLRRYGYL